MSNRIVSEIMNVPDAYLVLDAVQKALDEERKRRLKFYNDITEQEKVEFINGENYYTFSRNVHAHENRGVAFYRSLTSHTQECARFCRI